MKVKNCLNTYFINPDEVEPYLSRVRNGNDAIYRTTFYGSKGQSEVLGTWAKTLNTLGSEFSTLLDFENDLRAKVGPTSVMQPLDKRIDSIRAYYDLVGNPGQPIHHEALSRCYQEWGAVREAQLRPRPQAETVMKMKLSTQAGSPMWGKRRDVVYETIPCRVWKLDDLGPDIDAIGWHNHVAAVLGWRGQEGGPEPDDVKQRVVWMFPLSVNVLEQTVYQPLIEAFQKHRLVPAWCSNEDVDLEITRLFDSKDPADLIVCTDFSKYDQHFNENMSDAAYYLIDQLMADCKEKKDWLKDVFPIKYKIPLILDVDVVYYGRHGMGSGSGGTNFDETIVHRALQHEAALLAGQELNLNSQCLGDDGILSYPGITVDAVVEAYSKHGQEMNPDKQYAATDHCVYLRRWHHSNYRKNGVAVGVYSTYRALGRLMYQERYYSPKMWGPKMVALRQLSIIENVRHHPLCEEFAEFCMKGDKYRLGLDIPGFLVNIEREAKEAKDVMPDFLGYTQSTLNKSSINDWWIVNFLKSRR
jgi:hypothetical protein